jgi:cytoskeletal protein CcmA (bactofilin family)
MLLIKASKYKKGRARIRERRLKFMGKRDIEPGDVEAFLGKNTSFEGKMTFEGMARLDGKFDGEISSGDFLFIGEHAVIDAEINVGILVVDGKVNGNVSATSKVAIHTTGKLYGTVGTPALVIEEGGLFEGSCKMERGAEASAEKVTPLKEKETKEEKIIDPLDEVY